MQLADSHCHLDDSPFDGDRDQVIERAREAGLKYLLCIGTGQGPPDLEVAIRMADAYDMVYATVGVHPNDAAKVDGQTFSDLVRLLQHPKVRAIGEIGLDYHWGVSKEMQIPVFAQQLAIAAEAQMPIVIHTRDAWNDTMRLLREHWSSTELPCIMHCFTGNAEQAQECLEMGFYLAFGGVATFPKATEIRAAVQTVPSDRLLLETDCPYLAPVPYRGTRNEPSYVKHTAEMVAQLRQVSMEDLARQTTENLERILFSERN